ncbi:HPr kinase/phosphorylase [Sphingorhabdus sp.]|uniref:HPr kinase/phosphorylase n=1 Tax=Sphingorhabdus sp. TaxID=1902408 RepID=UPI00391A5879
MRSAVHATAVDIGGHGVLLRGPSGSGKSDLALRLVDRGARLIGDDIVQLDASDGLPVIRCAPNIVGQIEVRGVGICSVDYVQSAPLRMVVEFATEIDRMPPEHQQALLIDYAVPLLMLDPFQASSALKVELALRSVIDAGLMPVAMQDAAANESLGF